MNNYSSYEEVVDSYKDFDFDEYFSKVTIEDVRKSIYKDNLSPKDLLNLLSPKAVEVLEEIAQRANKLTKQYFGGAVLLYTPLYLANYCVNLCAYCGYSAKNKIKRRKLTMEEIEVEAKAISSQGFKHILILTGESEYHNPTEYIVEATKILKKYFPSVSIEIYPMNEESYRKVVEAGVDGLTVYQEVYNKEIYKKVHIKGPKSNYSFRIDAPERGAKAGMRTLGIGALLGLEDFRKEAFFTGLHGDYLLKKYPEVDIAYSFPRIRPCVGGYDDILPLSDMDLVQAILAMRIFKPTASLNISTRESGELREHLIPLGVNKISAGVSTHVGGHSSDVEVGEEQFEISDGRSAVEIKNMLINKGYQPIFKDWETI